MNIFNDIELAFQEVLNKIPSLRKVLVSSPISVTLDVPKDKTHGDLSTNVAMLLAKKAGRNPKELAEEIIGYVSSNDIIKTASVAGPGFINVTLENHVWGKCLRHILAVGTNYGAAVFGNGNKVNIEYVSANPTGPLHAAHARGAVVGDALSRLLKKVGYEVCNEYYINDSGAQVDILGRSTFLRYREALGEKIGIIPKGYYPGVYLKSIAKKLVVRDGPKWLRLSENEWLPEIRAFAIDELMQSIRNDLSLLGISMDIYTSERSLVEAGRVDAIIQELSDRELIYEGVLDRPKGKTSEDWEPRPQLLFKSTLFGDDVDRAIKKADGGWTYFASDVAYHMDKFKRGYTNMIDVWGADHGGYVKRMEAAVRAGSNEKAHLDVKICQIVHLLQHGKPIRMSKRAGTFVTLEDVLKEVGKDVVRFIMLTRRNDQVLEFDFERVVEQSRDNPVFYVQYAHARCCSVIRHASEVFHEQELCSSFLEKRDLSQLTDESEILVMKELASWPRIVEGAARAHEPHRIAFYLTNLAGAFHSLWNKGKDQADLRFIIDNNRELTLTRIALVKALMLVIASGLDVMGIDPIEEMK